MKGQRVGAYVQTMCPSISIFVTSIGDQSISSCVASSL